MNVLVYRAGVIGGQLVHALMKSGNDVTVIARGAWKDTLQKEGLRIHHYIQKKDTVDHPRVLERPDDGRYDIAFAVMQYGDNSFDSVIIANALHIVLAFSLPVWILLVFFWLPMLVIQFKAFAKGFTPYPAYAKWFNLFVGAVPALVISMLIGNSDPWGPAIGTMFLSFGNAFTFGGLLAALPSEKQFEKYREKLAEVHR